MSKLPVKPLSKPMIEALRLLATPNTLVRSLTGGIIDGQGEYIGNVSAGTRGGLIDRKLITISEDRSNWKINDLGREVLSILDPHIPIVSMIPADPSIKREIVFYQNAKQTIAYRPLTSYSEAQNLIEEGQEVIIYAGERIGYVQVGVTPLNQKNIDPTLAGFECVGKPLGIMVWRVQTSAGLVEIIGYPVQVIEKHKCFN